MFSYSSFANTSGQVDRWSDIEPNRGDSYNVAEALKLFQSRAIGWAQPGRGVMLQPVNLQGNRSRRSRKSTTVNHGEWSLGRLSGVDWAGSVQLELKNMGVVAGRLGCLLQVDHKRVPTQGSASGAFWFSAPTGHASAAQPASAH